MKRRDRRALAKSSGWKWNETHLCQCDVPKVNDDPKIETDLKEAMMSCIKQAHKRSLIDDLNRIRREREMK